MFTVNSRLTVVINSKKAHATTQKIIEQPNLPIKLYF